MKQLIAISGKINSGKSTLARKLYEQIPNASIIPLAGCMKQCVELITGIEMLDRQPDGSYDYSRTQKSLPYGDQTLAQFIVEFAEKIREINPDCWIKVTERLIAKSTAQVIIIPDMRTKRELEWAKGLNALTVRIEGSYYPNEDGRSAESFFETDLDEINTWNYLIQPSTNKDLIISHIVDKVSKPVIAL